MAGRASDELRDGLDAGCEAAFASLYDRYGERMYRAAVRLLGSPADAEDAVQDAFVSLVRYRQSLARARDLEAYVFTTLRHAALRRRARRPAAATLPDQLPANPTPTPDDELARAVAQLPGPQREAIALKIDGQLTFAQIGEATGVSMNTAASRYREGIRKLRDWLGGDR